MWILGQLLTTVISSRDVIPEFYYKCRRVIVFGCFPKMEHLTTSPVWCSPDSRATASEEILDRG